MIHGDIHAGNVGMIDDVPYVVDLGYPKKIEPDFGFPMFGRVSPGSIHRWGN